LYRLYERRLKRELDKSVPVPRHVGVITDGNRRWAREFGATTADGHRAGAAKIVEFLGWCFEIDVEIVTLYVLSKENLARSAEEVSILIEIISDLVEKIAALDGVGVPPVGRRSSTPSDPRCGPATTTARISRRSSPNCPRSRSASTSTPRASPTPTSSSAPPESSGCRGS